MIRAYHAGMPPKRKISDEQWAEIAQMYEQWDPDSHGSITIDELIASFPIKISKQTFYTEAARRNVKLKSQQAPDQVKAQVEAMLEALVTARVRIRLLEQTLTQHGIPLP